MSVGEISVIIKLCEAIPKQNILCNRTWLASFGVSQTSHALFPNSGVSDWFRNFAGSTLKNGWGKWIYRLLPCRHLKVSPISYWQIAMQRVHANTLGSWIVFIFSSSFNKLNCPNYLFKKSPTQINNWKKYIYLVEKAQCNVLVYSATSHWLETSLPYFFL